MRSDDRTAGRKFGQLQIGRIGDGRGHAAFGFQRSAVAAGIERHEQPLPQPVVIDDKPRDRAQIVPHPGGGEQNELPDALRVFGGKGGGDGPAHRIAQKGDGPIHPEGIEQVFQLRNEECRILRAARAGGMAAPVKIVGQHAKALFRQPPRNRPPDEGGRGQPVDADDDGAVLRPGPLVMGGPARQVGQVPRRIGAGPGDRGAQQFKNEGRGNDRHAEDC